MKKKILLMGIVMLIVSGCSKKDVIKNLQCKKSDTISENIITEVINAQFKNNQIESSEIVIENVVIEKYVQFIGSLEEELKNKYNDYYDKKGISINIFTENNKVTAKINIDFNLIDENSKTVLNITDNISTYGETKDTLEKNGYKCN